MSIPTPVPPVAHQLGACGVSGCERFRARRWRRVWWVADFGELPSLPVIAAEVGAFDYVALDCSRTPPDLEVVARLARSYSEEDGGGERLRLVLVAGHPVDSGDFVVISYIWRAETRDVVWGLERWPSPERRLALYRLDAGFEALPAPRLHTELQEAGAAGVADQARAVLAA